MTRVLHSRNWMALIASVAVVVLFAVRATAANVDLDASLSISTPISIAETIQLSFGTFASGGTAGTVTSEGRSSLRSATGGVTLDASDEGSGGQFLITGTLDATFTWSVSESTVDLTNGTGGTMTITSFNLEAPAPLNVSGLGQRWRWLSATLAVGANQSSGTYSGTYTVNAIYD